MSNVIYWKPGSEVQRSRNEDVSHWGTRVSIWDSPEKALALISNNKSKTQELFYANGIELSYVFEDHYNKPVNER